MDNVNTVILSIVGFIAFFYLILYAGSFRMRRAATAFFKYLEGGNYLEAYTLMGSDFKKLVPTEQFAAFLEERGVFSVKEIKRYTGDFSIGGNNGTISPWLIREDDIYFKIKIHMARENMQWKVAAIDVQLRLAPAPTETASTQPVQQPPPQDNKSHRPTIH